MVYNLSEAVAAAYKDNQDAEAHYTQQYGTDYGFGFFYPPGAKLTDGIPEDFRWIVEPHWDQFPPMNPLYLYMVAFIWTILWVLSFFGNGLVMYLFLKTRSLRTPSNMLIVNLAFADFIMMNTQVPPLLHTVLGTGYWELGAFGCELIGMLATLSGCAALYTLIFISYDRYNVIVKGFNGVKLTSSMVSGMILFIWGWCLTWTTLPLFRVWGSYMPEGMLASCGMNYLSRDTSDVSFVGTLIVFFYVIPLILLFFFYGNIVKAVWDHEDAMREQARKMNVESLRNEDNKKMSTECRIAKVAMTNVLLWVSIWTPYCTLGIIGILGNQMTITPLFSQMAPMIAKTASVFNPIVYAISHPKYRLALQECLPWLCIHEPQDDVKSVASTETAQESK